MSKNNLLVITVLLALSGHLVGSDDVRKSGKKEKKDDASTHVTHHRNHQTRFHEHIEEKRQRRIEHEKARKDRNMSDQNHHLDTIEHHLGDALVEQKDAQKESRESFKRVSDKDLRRGRQSKPLHPVTQTKKVTRLNEARKDVQEKIAKIRKRQGELSSDGQDQLRRQLKQEHMLVDRLDAQVEAQRQEIKDLQDRHSTLRHHDMKKANRLAEDKDLHNATRLDKRDAATHADTDRMHVRMVELGQIRSDKDMRLEKVIAAKRQQLEPVKAKLEDAKAKMHETEAKLLLDPKEEDKADAALKDAKAGAVPAQKGLFSERARHLSAAREELRML